jgi:ABC-type nitrate/sulfonate/bicarbonate transport system permease component
MPKALKGTFALGLRLTGRAVPLVLFGVVWQVLCSSGVVNRDFLPGPISVAAAFADLFSGGDISKNLFVTIFRAAAGLLVGAGCGVWIGLMMARSQSFKEYVMPIVGGTYSLPKSALIPLFALWFGIGNVTAIAAVRLFVTDDRQYLPRYRDDAESPGLGALLALRGARFGLESICAMRCLTSLPA